MWRVGQFSSRQCYYKYHADQCLVASHLNICTWCFLLLIIPIYFHHTFIIHYKRSFKPQVEKSGPNMDTEASSLQNRFRLDPVIMEKFELSLALCDKAVMTKVDFLKAANRIVRSAVGSSGSSNELDCIHVNTVRSLVNAQHGYRSFDGVGNVKLGVYAEKLRVRATKKHFFLSHEELTCVFNSLGFDHTGRNELLQPALLESPAVVRPLLTDGALRAAAVRSFAPTVIRVADSSSHTLLSTLQSVGLAAVYSVKSSGNNYSVVFFC